MPEQSKFENMDLFASLEAIMKQNTGFYQSDLDIDKEIIAKAAASPHREDKTLLWFCRPSGTHCFRERDVFLKDTAPHNTWRFYMEQTSDRVLAYAIELTRTERGKIKGKPREEWAIVENCHEAIISGYDFESVQKALALDARTTESGKAVDLFSGMVNCGECGGAMIKKTVPSGKKKYTYFVCATHKNEKTCFSHGIRDTALTEIVLEFLKKHIRDVIDLADLLALTDTAQLQKAKVQKLRERLDAKEAEIDRYHRLLCSLYESLADGLIDQSEYQNLKKSYTNRRTQAEEQADAIRGEMEQEINRSDQGLGWIEEFRRYQNIEVLDRSIVVRLIERILIFRDRRVDIVYRWQNEFQWQTELLLRAQGQLPGREAV